MRSLSLRPPRQDALDELLRHKKQPTLLRSAILAEASRLPELIVPGSGDLRRAAVLVQVLHVAFPGGASAGMGEAWSAVARSRSSS